MSEHNYTYTDDNLSLNQAHSYDLLLQIEANSFHYAITFNKQLLAWAENCPLQELNTPETLRDILTANYKQTIVGLSSTGFTLVPRGLFDQEHITDFARLLDVNNHEVVYTQPIDSQNMIIYKVDTSLHNAICNIHAERINHKAKGWIKAIAATRPADSNLYLNIANGKVQILHFSNYNIRFYNHFNFNNHEELAYYTAFAAQELSLNPQELTLILSGEVNRTDKYFTYLSEFFGQVKLSDIQVLELPAQLEPHKLLTLAALSLCASSEEN